MIKPYLQTLLLAGAAWLQLGLVDGEQEIMPPRKEQSLASKGSSAVGQASYASWKLAKSTGK